MSEKEKRNRTRERKRKDRNQNTEREREREGRTDGRFATSVSSKKSPNVFKSCPNMISLEK